ncbi:MAG: hypothetical protein V3R37_00935, partial [Rhodospirillales bacterium]
SVPPGYTNGTRYLGMSGGMMPDGEIATPPWRINRMHPAKLSSGRGKAGSLGKENRGPKKTPISP